MLVHADCLAYLEYEFGCYILSLRHIQALKEMSLLPAPMPFELINDKYSSEVLGSVSSKGFAFAFLPVLPSTVFYFFHMIYNSKRYYLQCSTETSHAWSWLYFQPNCISLIQSYSTILITLNQVKCLTFDEHHLRRLLESIVVWKSFEALLSHILQVLLITV